MTKREGEDVFRCVFVKPAIILRNIVLYIVCLVFLASCATVPAKHPAAKAEPAREEVKQEAPVIAPVPSLPDVSIEVNIPATELTLYENDAIKFVKPVAIGSGVYPTPEQESLIKKIEWNPWWYPPASKWAAGASVTPPGPGNPLGLVKMPLSDGILFHGTNKVKSVGQSASHGCMRMYNEDAVEMAWYLQGLFTKKSDPSLLETYNKNRRMTYVVYLDYPVQVKLIYKPVIVRNGKLIFYKDHYKRLGNKRKAAIMAELVRSGVAMECIDEARVEALADEWPEPKTEVDVRLVVIGNAECGRFR